MSTRPRPPYFDAVTAALCLLNLLSLLFAGRAAVTRLFTALAVAASFVVIAFFWKGRNWARVLVLIASGMSLLELALLPLASPLFFGLILADVAVALFLLVWLNTAPVREYFRGPAPPAGAEAASAGLPDGRREGMAPGLKVGLAAIGCAALAAGLILVAASIWWMRHRSELSAMARAARFEGMAFGKTTDEGGCLAEALRRHRPSDGVSRTVRNELFFRGCLTSARPVSDFCRNVPRSTEIMSSARWQVARCRQANVDDASCRQLFSAMQQYCESPEHRLKGGRPSPQEGPAVQRASR
jgi:hypothetical protein